MLDQLDREGWELYRIEEDPTESHDVSAEHPDTLRELISLWWNEAERYKVLPLDGSLQPRLAVERPQTSRPRTRYVYYPGGPGRGQLYVDGRLVASAEFPHTAPLIFELEGLSCGYDFGSPADEEYEPPFAFTGTIYNVTVDVSGELIKDEEAEVVRLMAQQ